MSDEVKVNEQDLGAVAGGGANGSTWWENGMRMYNIVYGDTLSEIAWRFGTSVDRIMALNPGRITNPNVIKEGWIIRIY